MTLLTCHPVFLQRLQAPCSILSRQYRPSALFTSLQDPLRLHTHDTPPRLANHHVSASSRCVLSTQARARISSPASSPERPRPPLLRRILHTLSKPRPRCGLVSTVYLDRYGQFRKISIGPQQLNVADYINYTIVAICSTVFLTTLYATSESKGVILEFMNKNFVFNRENIVEGRWWTALTSAFQHDNIFHFLPNVYILYTVVPMMVYSFGPLGFVGISLFSQVACATAVSYWRILHEKNGIGRQGQRWDRGEMEERKVWQNRTFLGIKPTPETGNSLNRYGGDVGFSGVLSGCMVALIARAPRATWSIIFLPIKLPGAVMLAGLSALSWASMKNGWLEDIGHAGHLGGFAGGALGYLVFRRSFFGVM